MRINIELLHVETPDHIRVQFARLQWLLALLNHELGLSLKTLIAILHSVHIETENFTAVGHDIHPVALY